MENEKEETTRRVIENLSKGIIGNKFAQITHQGLKLLKIKEGALLCSFVASNYISDADGNWHAGAMATLMDVMAFAAVYTLAGEASVSVDFSVSFFSTVKIQERVEIEAKVVKKKGELAFVLIKIRREDNGEVIALAKQWMKFVKEMRYPSKL